MQMGNLTTGVLEVKFERSPGPTCPVDAARERHGGGNADTRQTSLHIACQSKQRRHQNDDGAKRIKVEQQPTIGHPERVPHLCRYVDSVMSLLHGLDIKIDIPELQDRPSGTDYQGNAARQRTLAQSQYPPATH